MILEKESLSLFNNALEKLNEKFSFLPPLKHKTDRKQIDQILTQLVDKLENNYPYFHPLYAGQMLKPPHPIARLAYMLSLWINPNNHALDGGRASSELEKEVVADIAKMFDWNEHLGHLTGGGTMANMEALWISSKRFPNKKIVASELAHYTHGRISSVLSLPFESILSDKNGKMNINELEKKLRTAEIGTVVATLGSTGIGSLDPLGEILELKKDYSFHLHVDTAYGGYYTLVNNLSEESSKEYRLLSEVDSIVIDPHKHGLQPYGCGCVLFKDPSVGQFYKHDSPYTYFSSDELHLGEISLECSRAGAAAVALWATHQLLPPVRNGEFAQSLQQCRNAALDFYKKLQNDKRFFPILKPELDIVIWAIQADSVKESSELSNQIFEACAKEHLHLALIHYPTRLLPDEWKEKIGKEESLICLRSCLMKPEHDDWIDRIWDILSRVSDRCLEEIKS